METRNGTITNHYGMINYIRAVHVEECFKVERSEAFITHWHYTLAQFYGPGYVVVKIRWDKLSHMGLDIHKVVLLWYLVNGIINIERCHRVMHKGDGRMHFSEALMHDEIAP